VRNLSEIGLFVRRTDPADARRAFITLSDQAFDAVVGWLRRFLAAFQMR
jgi:DNA-binding MarR family transcriptional regulator